MKQVAISLVKFETRIVLNSLVYDVLHVHARSGQHCFIDQYITKALI